MNDLIVVDQEPPQSDCRALVEVFERNLALPPRSIQEAIAWHEDARKLRERVRVEKLSLDLSNRTTAIWLARCRQIGAMLANMQLQAGNRTPGFRRETPTLRQLGLTKKKSHQFQLLARIPDEDFRGWIWDRIERGLQITKSEGLYIAKSYLDQPGPTRTRRHASSETMIIPADLVWDVVDEIHEAANRIMQGGPAAAALLTAIDFVMDRIVDYVGGRRSWEDRRSELDAVVGGS